MSRTSTIARRKLEVYFPDEDSKRDTQEKARQKGVSASEYIFHCIRMADGIAPGPSREEHEGLLKRLSTLESERDALARENAGLKEVSRRYEDEVAILRSREVPIPDRSIEDGFHRIDRRLIDALQSIDEVDESLLRRLGIKGNDQEAIRKLRRDLDTLVSYGLVEPTREGWRWVR